MNAVRHGLLVVGLAVAVAVAAGCGAPPPSAEVASATALGPVAHSSLIVGRDGGDGARLWGHQVFIYGDSFVSKADANGSSFHSNSFSFTDDMSASDGISGLSERVDAVGSPLPLVPNTDDEAAFIEQHAGDSCAVPPCGARWAMWPGSPVYDEARDRTIVSYQLVYAEPGAFNFHGVGNSLALWSSFDDVATRPEANRCADHPTLMFCQDEHAWGTAMVLGGTDLFVFACDGDASSVGCRLARVPVADAFDRDQWRGWDGHAWSTLDQAATLFDGAPILRVAFDTHLGAWLAVYSAPLSDDVMYRTAPAITGPWSGEAKLFTADHGASDGGWTYDALLQPDYAEGDGAIEYVTYSRPNGTPFGSEFLLERIAFE